MMEQQANPVEFPVLPGGWCNWHDGPSETALAVQWGESTSGPPKPLYACAPCREQRNLPAAAVHCQDAPVPQVDALTWEQIQGRNCVACGAPLTDARVWRDTVIVHQDGYGLPFEVYACPVRS
ncbi:hypothetical protein OHS33_11740 [Streptomyces sp. NBC_00536]|uniref:hypothetical protein n=1 Tax=Streptomyces sp. NBC_00536 TaxID=2975769 RepID=UPI002E81990D|nr:hypothetical protein [Streptomyces sp. NBC_00536]WUC78949.1 hypothetical protein OHS33_11740 [Streptomyces sp. NBC_00536]